MRVGWAIGRRGVGRAAVHLFEVFTGGRSVLEVAAKHFFGKIKNDVLGKVAGVLGVHILPGASLWLIISALARHILAPFGGAELAATMARLAKVEPALYEVEAMASSEALEDCCVSFRKERT